MIFVIFLLLLHPTSQPICFYRCSMIIRADTGQYSVFNPREILKKKRGSADDRAIEGTVSFSLFSLLLRNSKEPDLGRFMPRVKWKYILGRV